MTRSWYQRLAWLGVLIVGVIAYLLVLQNLIATQNLNFFPSLLLIGAGTVPLSVLVLATSGGREDIVPTTTVVLAALAGGLLGVIVAGVLEYDTMKQLSGLPMTAVALIEETAKLLVPTALLLFSKRVRDARAGTIIGVAAGAGFAVLETMGYGFNALLSAKSVAAVDSTLLLRALLSPAGHIAWTGLICTALWQARFGARPHRWLWVVVAYVGAVALHALWDGSSVFVVHVGVVIISVGLLIWIIHRSHRMVAVVTR